MQMESKKSGDNWNQHVQNCFVPCNNISFSKRIQIEINRLKNSQKLNWTRIE